MKHTLLAIIALAGLGGPGIAEAYSSPEEVLFEEVNSRRANEIVRQREAERADRLKQSAPKPAEELPPAPAEDTPPAEGVPAEPADEETPGGGEYFLLDPATARLLERLANQQNGSPTILHPGAPLDSAIDYPLAPTGPGAVVVAVAMLGALGWTGYRVWKAEKIG